MNCYMLNIIGMSYLNVCKTKLPNENLISVEQVYIEEQIKYR
jgi:hypothetical protein